MPRLTDHHPAIEAATVTEPRPPSMPSRPSKPSKRPPPPPHWVYSIRRRFSVNNNISFFFFLFGFDGYDNDCHLAALLLLLLFFRKEKCNKWPSFQMISTAHSLFAAGIPASYNPMAPMPGYGLLAQGGPSPFAPPSSSSQASQFSFYSIQFTPFDGFFPLIHFQFQFQMQPHKHKPPGGPSHRKWTIWPVCNTRPPLRPARPPLPAGTATAIRPPLPAPLRRRPHSTEYPDSPVFRPPTVCWPATRRP